MAYRIERSEAAGHDFETLLDSLVESYRSPGDTGQGRRRRILRRPGEPAGPPNAGAED